MSNLAKFEFVALDITGKNFLSWILDAEIHLDANGFGNTIKEKNTTSIQEKAKAMIFLRRSGENSKMVTNLCYRCGMKDH